MYGAEKGLYAIYRQQGSGQAVHVRGLIRAFVVFTESLDMVELIHQHGRPLSDLDTKAPDKSV